MEKNDGGGDADDTAAADDDVKLSKTGILEICLIC
jgi:hypothetical protein